MALLAACAGRPGEQADATATVTIMTFNVENLFDTSDDPDKDDQTYLPLAAKRGTRHVRHCGKIDNDYWRAQCLEWDWNETILRRKLAALARAILQVNNGRGPDILALQEIENLGVLERLRTEYLGVARYRPGILIEGADSRGIDVAFLSRLALIGEPELHAVPFSGFSPERIADTRGILEATFRLPDGEALTGFVVHFPAPFHPVRMREQAYVFLNELRAGLPAGRAAFAAGDFNTPAAEDAAERMLDRLVRPGWVVVHELGCETCPGTQYYGAGKSWSFLDMILWARPAGRGENTTWRPVPGSARLANQVAEQLTASGTPARFRLPRGTGVSDHWPLVFDIQSN